MVESGATGVEPFQISLRVVVQSEKEGGSWAGHDHGVAPAGWVWLHERAGHAEDLGVPALAGVDVTHGQAEMVETGDGRQRGGAGCVAAGGECHGSSPGSEGEGDVGSGHGRYGSVA